jgi:hypothetical protein
MKWLRRSDLLPVPPHSIPTTGSPKRESDLRSVTEAVVEETGVVSETTEKSAVPKEIESPISVPPATDKHRRPGGRQMTTTLASPIPAMLAESMGLALEKDPAPDAATAAGEASPEAIMVFGASAVRRVNDPAERRDIRPTTKPATNNPPDIGRRTPHRR